VTKNFAGVALPIAVVGLVVGVLAGGPASAITYFLMRLAFELVEPSFIPVVSIGIRLVSQFVSVLIMSFFLGGVVEFALKVARGQPVEFGEVFGGFKYFGPIFVATLGTNLAVVIGGIFCVIPGLILGAGLSMSNCLIVDQKLGGIEALKKSWEMTTGHKGSILVYLLLAFLVIVAGVAACCLGALLVSGPLIAIGTSYIYLKLKGEQPRLA
jgi:uncharacterized membrane protein